MAEMEEEMSISERIKLVFSGMWGFIGPFVKMFLSKAGPVLAAAALAAVKATAEHMTKSSGAEKRDAAYDAIVTDLRKQGINIGVDVTTSMINAAIEVAVQKLKS
jgi:hypothetical protein